MAWNICLVSDNEAIQHLFTRTFSDRKDISIKFCTTAEEAVREASTETLQLLIASATLPDKDGYDLCKELKDELDVKFPVLLIEDIFEDIDLDRCLEAKTDGFIAKPFEEDLIAEKVEEVLHAIEKKPLQAEEEELTEMTSMAEEETASTSMLSSEEEEDIMDLTDLVGEEETATSFEEPALEKAVIEEPGGEMPVEEEAERVSIEEETAVEEEFAREELIGEESGMPPSITSALEESVSELEKMEAIEAEEAFVFEEGISETLPEEETAPEEIVPETVSSTAPAMSVEDIEKLVNEKVEKAVDEAIQRTLDEKLPGALRKSLAKFLSDFSELLK